MLRDCIFKNGKRRREQRIIGARAGRRKCEHGILVDAPFCTLSCFCHLFGGYQSTRPVNTMSAGEGLLRAVEAPLFWLGALTAAWASVCLVHRLLSGFKVWVLGNGRFLSPNKLGKWAGETRVQNTLHLLAYLQITKFSDSLLIKQPLSSKN